MRRSVISCCLLILPLAMLSGCGSGNEVWVTGKLAKGGAKYTLPEGQRLTITLYAIEAKDSTGKEIKNEPFLVTLDPDGESFKVPGKDGKGIPPGKYRVAIVQKFNREALEATKDPKHAGKPVDRETDFLDGKFSPDKSPIVREIKGSSNLVIDLDKPSES